ncbi:MAG TPA: 50S ribosomal protein L33 [bacterium]|nr:50S ribosomal protein L33 [bacterium]HPP87599.1 50S ribosomal protein L33 [bacterium]
MAKDKKVLKVTLECSECKNKNYSTTRNKQNTKEKLQLKKYCRFDRKHTLHKESK